MIHDVIGVTISFPSTNTLVRPKNFRPDGVFKFGELPGFDYLLLFKTSAYFNGIEMQNNVFLFRKQTCNIVLPLLE